MCDKGVFKADTEALYCKKSGAVTYWNRRTVRRTVSDVTFEVPIRHSKWTLSWYSRKQYLYWKKTDTQ